MIFYKGFSTKQYEETGGSFELHNVACVEQDLMNQLLTLRGDRVNMPTWGTRISLLVFEPNDQEVQDILHDDVKQVIDDDPRVELLNLDIITDTDRNVLIASAKVNYKEFNVTKNLNIEIPK